MEICGIQEKLMQDGKIEKSVIEKQESTTFKGKLDSEDKQNIEIVESMLHYVRESLANSRSETDLA